MAPSFSISEDNFKFIMACLNASSGRIDYNLLCAETGLAKDPAYKKLWALKKRYCTGSGATKMNETSSPRRSRVTKPTTPSPRKQKMTGKNDVKKELEEELEELSDYGVSPGEEREEGEKREIKRRERPSRKAKEGKKRYRLEDEEETEMEDEESDGLEGAMGNDIDGEVEAGLEAKLEYSD